MPVTINNEEYLTTGEAAKYLQVSAATFLKWQKQHNLKHMVRPGMGQKKFFKRSDLDTLVEWREGSTQ